MRTLLPTFTKQSKVIIQLLIFVGVLLVLTWSCKKEDPPTLTTLTVTEITGNTAQSGGNITDDSGASVTARGVVWSTSENPTINNKEGSTSDGIGDGQFVSNLTGLSPGTTYFIRAYAENSTGTAYGNQAQFTTIELAAVTTAEVTDITSRSATSGGNVTDDGGAEVIARGIIWSASENPTIDDNEGKTSDGLEIGEFTSELTELSPGTTYYVRAYAINDEGTSYGGLKEFTTEGELATVITSEITKITQTTAISGGNITDDGGATVAARGVCWSTSQNPTINDSKTEDGTGAGSFASSISGLEPNTMYYVRAYATNSEGTGYGSAMSFATLEEVVDADGNGYSTVVIGNQEWFAENLKTTKYNNGTPIPNVTSNTDWSNLTSGAYAWYDNNEATYKDVYGALYNWYAVNTGNLCPTGWHVPTDAEWTQLTDYVGGLSVAAGKLKSTRTVADAHPRWESPNIGATDEYGFSALPGGYRYPTGLFYYIGYNGIWWSSSDEGNPDRAWYRYMSSEYGYVGTHSLYKQGGFSVRCVRD